MSWVEHSVGPALTPREQQVLELVAGGYSAKEAANEIGIAPRTVERHIENVRLKMRAKNRAHMVTQAVAAGYLKISERGLEQKPLLILHCSEPTLLSTATG